MEFLKKTVKPKTGKNSGKSESKNMVKAIIWMSVAVVFLAVSVVVGFNLHSTQQAINRQDAIREAGMSPIEPDSVAAASPAISAISAPDVPVEADASDELPSELLDFVFASPRHKQPRPNERDINFEELWAINPDVIAWIEIPGTVIDYPIVSTLCNEFYIYHDLMGQRTGYGALFTDIRNHENWQDPFIIIYGHNMRDGRKFADLHRFRGWWVFENFTMIHIYTPHGQFDYRVFAAYERDDEHLMAMRDFRDRNTMREYLDSVRYNEWHGAHIDMDDVTEDDWILTLSTCVGVDDRRFLVQAVFVEPVFDN